MNGKVNGWTMEYLELRKAKQLISGARKEILRARESNPTEREEIMLAQRDIELQLKSDLLQKRLLALAAAQHSIRPPSKSQINEIKALTSEVEAQTNQAITASTAMSFTGKVLELVAELA